MRLTLSRWPLVAFQCWVSLLRFLAALFVVGHLLWFLITISGYQFSDKSYFDMAVLRLVPWLVFWIWIALNDVSILTVDLKRTHTYLGCIAVQAGVNFLFTIFIILYATPHRMGGYLYFQNDIILVYVLSGIPMVVAWISSVGLLIISLRPIFLFRSLVSVKHLWKVNTKDALSGAISVSKHQTLTLFGSPRDPPIKTSASLNKFVANLLFRRVRPAETRMYAFARNMFAVVAMAALIFRTVAALIYAQNEIEMRVTSEDCTKRASEIHSIGILMERLTNDSTWNDLPLAQGGADITVSTSWGNQVGSNYKSYGEANCAVQWSTDVTSYIGSIFEYHTRTLELYTCNQTWTNKLGDYNRFSRGGGTKPWRQMFVYNITIRPRSSTSNERILESQMPYIWLLNSNELASNLSLAHVDEVRSYQPPWELLRGSHVEAEAKLITRRFIKSSIMRDILLYAEPEYRPLSLYPIVESSVVARNSTDRGIATATVRTSLTPRLMSLRKQTGTQVSMSGSDNVCDFIDDHRTGTVVDVLGSVGGLFALLQAMHVLLFGRPLLWGLTGAKLITPFGLFGNCSSREFKRRLREDYHNTSPEDGMETIQIGKFLRDFVIEFGPADLDFEPRPSQQSAPSSPKVVTGDEDAVSSQVPLMHLRPDDASTLRVGNRYDEPQFIGSERPHNAV
ncbi:putative transmembrane protein [Rhizoctonia solani 123E]|uniref:Putative transmembrane protein n=1 Tax=Rhizoctonia solani 123E TaxID=1423351 RepID=A0A074S5L8_9AGAM|nr:putative transmembrane protein [Rhizoctonia solani 123E]